MIGIGGVMAGHVHCDIVIVGGGLAGSVLGASMARAGSSVLIVEKETAFRDRVRGEVLLPWGSVEAKALGIYDLLLEGCARAVQREIFSFGGEMSAPRDYPTSTPQGTCALSFFHPAMQEQLLAAAAQEGAAIRRGASVKALRPAEHSAGRPEVDIETESGIETVSARILVGADGRESRVAAQLGFIRERDEPELCIGGLQMAGDLEIEHALYFSLSRQSGRGSILLSNRPGNFRAYLLHHTQALPRRLSGARDYQVAKQHFAEIGWPKDWLEVLQPHGTFATFDGAHQWVHRPTQGNCVLVGDAAGSSDPVWGNGLSRTLRDVRLLRDRLLESSNWPDAAAAYAEDHDDAFHRLRRAERLCAKLHFPMTEDADAARLRAYDLITRNPELNPDITGRGPEARWSEAGEAALLRVMREQGNR
jgi:2-polyprenyl-6-methoxyphenol hydroxylase-like FAD-dependent oxidoreductase